MAVLLAIIDLLKAALWPALIFAIVFLFRRNEQISRLVNELAFQRARTYFERVFGAIYGSQIAGLRALKAAGGHSSLKDAIAFFNQQKAESNQILSNVSFDDWLRFLTAFSLVKVESETLILTQLGDDFLAWIDSDGAPKVSKPG